VEELLGVELACALVVLAVGAPLSPAGWPVEVPAGLLEVWPDEPDDVVVLELLEEVDEESELEVPGGVAALVARLSSVVPWSVTLGGAALGFRKVAGPPVADPDEAEPCLTAVPAVFTVDGGVEAGVSSTRPGLMTAAAITASAVATCG
jgi:hypothetical protein